VDARTFASTQRKMSSQAFILPRTQHKPPIGSRCHTQINKSEDQIEGITSQTRALCRPHPRLKQVRMNMSWPDGGESPREEAQ